MEEHNTTPTFGNLFSLFLDTPYQTQIGITLCLILWIIGGNVIVLRSMKRRGIPYWKVFVPSTEGLNIFFGMNTKECITLIILAILALGFGAWGLSAQTPIH